MTNGIRTRNGIMALMLTGILLLSTRAAPASAMEEVEVLPEVVQEAVSGADGKNDNDMTELHSDSVSADFGGNSIVAFDLLAADVSSQDVPQSTPLADLNLPEALTVTVEDENGEQTVANVPVMRWRAEPEYDPHAMGTYIFTPQLAAEYGVADGAELPEITVQVCVEIRLAAAQQPVLTYAELKRQISVYADATEDMKIILAPGFPTDLMPQTFTVQGNAGGHSLTICSADDGAPAVLTRSESVSGDMFRVNSGAHLILQDVVLDGDRQSGRPVTGSLVSVDGGKLTTQTGTVLRNNYYNKHGGTDNSGGGVSVFNGGVFIMEDGRITGNETFYQGGGGVHVSTTNTTTTFIMNGGYIVSNTSAQNGGGVFVNSTYRDGPYSSFVMAGGEISTNTAASTGGGVYVVGDFLMEDGEISDNTSLNSSGGGVCVAGSFTMTDGRIINNTAGNVGGGLYVLRYNSAKDGFLMKNGVISNNEAKSGGGVCASNCTVTMQDGQIIDNSAAENGGGIHATGSGDFTIEKGLIFDNTADQFGGGLFISGRNAIMRDGKIVENYAVKDGGGVYLLQSSFTVEEGMISGNTSDENGGGVFASNSLITLQGGKIDGNSAAETGGGITTIGSRGFTMEKGLISENKAGYGGGLFIYAKIAVMEGGQITKNTASFDGGGVYINESHTELSTIFTMKDGLIAENAAENGGGLYISNRIDNTLSGEFVMEDGLILFNSASNGGSVYAVDGNHLTMNSGLIFGQGSSDNSVVQPAAWEPKEGDDGIVIRWSGASGDTYLYDDDKHLHYLPASGAQTVWRIDAGRYGVAYARNGKTGFIELPVTVKYPLNSIYISGVLRYGETLSAPSILDAPPTGEWGGHTYQWTRDGEAITGAVGSAYTQVREDIGRIINVTITAENGYAPISSTNSVPTAKALQPAPSAFDLDYTYDPQTGVFTVTMPERDGAEYSFGGITYDSIRTATGIPGNSVTGHMRYAETATHEVSLPTSSSATLPFMVAAIAVTGQDGANSITTKGGTLQMLADVQPSGANQLVTWTIESGVGATIDSAGLLSAVADGVVIVRATAVDGSGVYGEMQVVISGQSGIIPSPTAYTVTYCANGGVGRVPIPTAIRQGTRYTIAEPALIKYEGQRFKEWNTDITGRGTGYTPGEIITMPNHNLTLYAIWGDIPAGAYTVTFDPRGGSVSPVTMQTDGEQRLAYLPVPNRSGSYRFTGWYTEASGGALISRSHVFTEDTVLYAHWKHTGGTGGNSGGEISAYTVTYHANSGDGSYEDSGLALGDTYVVKNQYETGIAYHDNSFVFTGWNTRGDGEGTMYDPKDTFVIRENVTLYAQWQLAEPWPELNKKEHMAYVAGYPDGTVRPNARITRGETAAIFFRLLTEESRGHYWSDANGYRDVTSEDWFNDAVSTMTNAGIITGYEDGTFGGNDPITRAEFAVIAAGFDDGRDTGAEQFSDLANHWSKEYIDRVSKNGWVTGYPDSTFKPDQYITRAEAMTLVNHMLGRDNFEKVHIDPDEIPRVHNNMAIWSDNEPGRWYYAAVQEATNSHTYERDRDGYESWVRILPAADWTVLK